MKMTLDVNVTLKYQEMRFQSGSTIKVLKVTYHCGLVQNFQQLLCLSLCLDDEDEYSFVCVVDIFINGLKRTLAKNFFENYRCDHRWFYGASQSLLQQEVGNFIQGDWNHVEISCKISCWTSNTGRDIAPSIARLGVHVKCICGLHNSIISHENHELVQPMGNRISKRIAHQRLRPFLPRGCRFILRRLYHTQCPTRSVSGRPILKARKISSKRKRRLVAGVAIFCRQLKTIASARIV